MDDRIHRRTTPDAAWIDRPRVRAGVVAALALLAIGVGVSTIHRAAWSEVHRSDFTVYTAAGQAVLDGTNIYDAENQRGWLYMYLPIFAVLVTPLALLSDEAAAAVWYLLSLAMLVHTLWMAATLARSAFPDTRGSPFEISLWTLLAIAWQAMSGIARGQASLLVMYLVTLAVWAYTRRRTWLAGGALAGAIVLKVFPGLLLAYFLFKRQWRMFISACAWLVVLVFVAPSLVFGVGGNLQLLNHWVRTVVLPAVVPSESRQVARYEQMADPRIERNQSLDAVFIRLIAPDEGQKQRERLAQVLAAVASVALLGVAAWACWRGRGSPDDPRTPMQAATIIGLMLFISPVSWVHNYTALAIPAAMITALGGRRHSPWWRTATAAYLVYLTAAILALLLEPMYWIGTLLWGTLVIWGVLVAWLIVAGRAEPAEGAVATRP